MTDGPRGQIDPNLPDLVFYKPSDWSSFVVLSRSSDGQDERLELTQESYVYLTFAVTNVGASIPYRRFLCDFLIDGESLTSTWVDYSFRPSYYTTKGVYLGRFSVGPHTLTIILDSHEWIEESDETNNELTVDFTIQHQTANQSPVVDAGPDQIVLPGAWVTLAGDAVDPDGDSLAYRWSQSSGAAVQLSDPTAPVTTFIAPDEYAILRFLLRVSDGEHSPTDTVTVTVDPNYNQPPTADAGPDGSGISGQLMSLTGSGTDPEQGTLSYTWIQLAGTTDAPPVELIGSDQQTVSLVPPEWDFDYDLLLQLTVTDPMGASASDTTVVRIDSPDPHKVVVPYALKAEAGVAASGLGGAGLLDDTFVGVVLANPNQLAEESAEVKAYTGAGGMLQNAIRSIPAEGQVSFLAQQLTEDESATSIVARGWNLPVQGFFLVGENALGRLDGIGGGLVEGTVLKFLVASSSAAEETYLQLFNTEQAAAQDVEIALHGSSGEVLSVENVTIEAGGSLQTSIGALLGTGDGIDEGYVSVASPVALRGFELTASAQTFAALTGQTVERIRKLSGPQFFVAPDGGSVLRILNADASPVTVDVIAHNDVGVTIAQASATIAGGELFSADLAEFLELDTSATRTGYLEVVPRLVPLEDGRKLVGALTFYGEGYASTLPLIRQGRKRTLFLHVAQSDAQKIFTGLALQNPNEEQAQVEVEVYSAGGELTAFRNLTLAPGERVVDLLNGDQFMGPGFEQVNGHIKVKSDRPIVNFALFGASDLAYLSAIEGQAPQLEIGNFQVTRATCGDNQGPELDSIQPDPRKGIARIPEGRRADFQLVLRDDSEQQVGLEHVERGIAGITTDLAELTALGIVPQPEMVRGSDPYKARLQFAFQVPQLDQTTEVTVSATASDVKGCTTEVRFSFVLLN